MGGYAVSGKTGRVQTGEVDYLWTPRTPRPGKRGVILCHGAQQGTEFMDPVGNPSSVRLAAALAQAGFTCIGGFFGGDTFANDTSNSRIDSAFAALISAGCASDKVCILGISMGGGAAIRYAQTNPTKVAAIVGICPMVDPNDVYQNNRASAQASLGTAWGVTYPTALPSRALLSSSANMALITSIPILIGYSTADAVIPSALVTAFAVGTGATATVIDTVSGHTDLTFGSLPITTIAPFLVTNGA